MAITKVKALHVRLDDPLEYIKNGEKTLSGNLISSYGCSPETAAIEMKIVWQKNAKSNAKRVGYHMLQSFLPEDDITPEEAHLLGKKLADRVLGGKYQYVISTHIDKGHIHNHIIFNSVGLDNDTKMYRWSYRERDRIEEINDNLCRSKGLSVIEEKSGMSAVNYSVWKAQGNSPREILRKYIDDTLKQVKTLDELKNKLEYLYGIKMRIGKTITYSINDGEKTYKFRDRKLGEAYSPDGLEKRLGKEEDLTFVLGVKKQNIYVKEKRVRKVIDIDKNKKAQSSKNYSNALYALNASAKLMSYNYIQERGFLTASEFVNNYNNLIKERAEISKEIDRISEQIKILSMEIDYIKKYRDNKKIYDEYCRNKSDDFYEKHKDALLDFSLAQIHFNNKQPYINPFKISLKDCFINLKNMRKEKSNLYARNSELCAIINQDKTVAYNIQKMFNYEIETDKKIKKINIDKSEKIQKEK